jgi:hypothetical protein
VATSNRPTQHARCRADDLFCKKRKKIQYTRIKSSAVVRDCGQERAFIKGDNYVGSKGEGRAVADEE